MTTSKPRKNLPEGRTTTTFIIENEDLNAMKDLAYTNRKSITETFREAITQYIKRHKGEILKRPKK